MSSGVSGGYGSSIHPFLFAQEYSRETAKTEDRGSQGQRVPAMYTQPARQGMSPARHFAIEPHASHAGKITLSAEHCVARWLMCAGAPRVFGRRDNFEIEHTNIFLASTEPAPRGERIAHAAQPQSASKVVPTARRHDQHRQPEFHLGILA